MIQAVIEFIIRFIIAALCAVVLLPVIIVTVLPVVLVLACSGPGSYASRFKREYQKVIKWWKRNWVFYTP